ncbi:uncharacterized protein LOC143055217 [Mytilus galloprovincialis]|uniref:uncharacterized protein LOC143055217 n=1 Tax=Mytilus galloprovincialis TaxID=29158 RepID=UPI003F7B3D5F
MRRLMWQKKKDVTSTQSTDGIEVEKCNINIANGKWSPCNETDDDLARLIYQVYKVKNINVEGATEETVVDQQPVSSNADESSVIGKNILKSSDEIDHRGINDGDTEINSYVNFESDPTVLEGISRADINASASNNRDKHVVDENELIKIEPDNFELKNVKDSKLKSFPNKNKSDPVNDEKLKELTSKIMTSCLQNKDEDQVGMAFCWLWDFAGQKDFYATHQVFLSKFAVYLLVTDSLEFSTAGSQGIDFEDSAQYVSFWFDAIHCYWSTTKKGKLDPPIIVICTNEDHFKKSSERDQRKQQFIDNLGQVLYNQEKKGHLRKIYFISNTEDDDCVFEEIREEISRQAMAMRDWGQDCPLKWLLFQQVLLKLKESKVPISSIQRLLKIAKHEDINISKDDDVKQCLQYCHDIGTVVYFNEEKLADFVILDPKWLIDAFRCLVSDKIENNIKVSDDWQTLKDTGQISESLISLLFSKEPELKFEANKEHLIEVMKRFDIIVNLKDSNKLYMPCMIKSCSFSEVRRQFSEGSQSTRKTSWLCLEFKFLPPAFFNHIIAWYIKQYRVSIIIDKENRRTRNALYRQVGVFDLDKSGCEQLVVCEGPNTIALQVWDSRISNKTYGNVGSDLFRFVKELRNRYSLNIQYSNTFTCKDGDFTINRKTIEDLFTTDYRCIEHNTNHVSDDLVKSWDFSEELK